MQTAISGANLHLTYDAACHLDQRERSFTLRV